MGLHGPNLKMGEPLSDDNEYGRNQVGSNPPGEPHISGGIRGPSGAKLGNWGDVGGKPPQKIKSVRLRSPMLSLRALGMKMMFFQVVFRVSGPRGPEKNYNFHKLGDKNYNFHKFQFLGSFGLFSPGTGPGMVGDRFLMKFCVDWYHRCLK